MDTTVNAVTNLGKELTCTICLSLFRNPAVAPCTHAFCRSCVQQLVQSTESKWVPVCPQCRKPLSVRGLREDAKLARLV